MNALTGTVLHLRLALRVERLRLMVWPVVILGLLWAMGDSMGSLYPDQPSRDRYAALNELSPVIQAINGPGHGLRTTGGIVVFEIGGYLLVVIALMAMTMVVRGTRGEEASGRAELTLATRTGPAAQLTAVMLLVSALSVLIGAGAAAVLLGLGLPTSGSLLYGAGLAGVGLVFTAVGALAAQASSQPSTALGLTAAVLGAAYAARAVGDVGDGPWSWFSPLGWAQAAAPFATTGPVTERTWPLVLSAGVAVVLGAGALVIRSRRELGASLLGSRPGPPSAGRHLTGPIAGALRSARATAIGWVTAVLLLGTAFGAAAEDIDAVFAASDGIDLLLGFEEGSIRDGYFTFALQLLVCAAAVVGLLLAARLRVEERAGLAEIILATRVGRARWLASGAVTAFAVTSAVVLAAGVGIGVGYTLAASDTGELGRVLTATVLYLPGVWLLTAVMLLAIGIHPRLTWAPWAVFGVSTVVALLGSALQLERPWIWLSPFEHLPGLPVDDPSMPVAIVLTAALAVTGAAFLCVGRRDVPR